MDDQIGQFEMVVRRDGDGASVVVAVRGELDLHGAGLLADRMTDLIDRGVPAVEIDARNLTFIDSSGIKALLDVRQAAHEAGVEFSVGPASDPFVRVARITGVSDLLLPG